MESPFPLESCPLGPFPLESPISLPFAAARSLLNFDGGAGGGCALSGAFALTGATFATSSSTSTSPNDKRTSTLPMFPFPCYRHCSQFFFWAWPITVQKSCLCLYRQSRLYVSIRYVEIHLFFSVAAIGCPFISLVPPLALQCYSSPVVAERIFPMLPTNSIVPRLFWLACFPSRNSHSMCSRI